MSTLILTNTISQKLISFDFPRISPKMIGVLGFVFIILSVSFYIYQINALTKAGFSVMSYEKQIVQLSQENKSLEMNFSQTNSLSNLEFLLSNLNYQRVNQIHYLQILSNEVASK